MSDKKSDGGKGRINSRHEARQAALQALYQIDSLAEWKFDSSSDEKIELFFRNFYSPEDQSAGRGSEYNFSRFLTEGVLKNHEQIDKLITAKSKNWSIERMNRIDRNILRIGVFEITNCPETPLPVIINEAIELTKSFGSESSMEFINGILDSIGK